MSAVLSSLPDAGVLMAPRKLDELAQVKRVAASVDRWPDPAPMAVDAVTDARSVDRLFVVGSPGRKTERMSPKTVSSYKHYWMVFVDWCESNGQCALPASPTIVHAFIQTRFDPATPLGAVRKRTAYTMLAAIEHANVQLTRQRGLYRAAIGFLKTLEYAPVTLPIVDRNALEEFLASLGDSLEHMRLRCVLLLIFEELLHAPEIVALTRDHYARSEELGVSALYYRSAVDKQFDWHPITEQSAAAIDAWIEQARITGGPLFPRLRRGCTVTSIAMTKGGLEQTIVAAQTKRLGPRITARSLRRGRAADVSHPQAARELRDEQQRRIGAGELQYVQYRWKDGPSAMEQWFRERERAARGES